MKFVGKLWSRDPSCKGPIDVFLINLNAEIVACILSFRKSRHKPNLENTSKYGFSPDLGGKMAAF